MKKRSKTKSKLVTILIPLCILLVLISIGYGGYYYFFKLKEKKFLETIDNATYVNITKYAIYGIHLNIEGNFSQIDDTDNYSLVLSNGKDETTIDWKLKKEDKGYSFKTSDYINDGIVLDDLPKGEYYLLLKVKINEIDQNITKYYSVQNKTKYGNLEYYTMTKNNKNNRINIEWNTYEELPTLRFTIKESTLPNDVYDITIDPGHDVSDPGSVGIYNGVTYQENDMNLFVSLALKKDLEDMGFKVAMTRDDVKDSVNIYGLNGSATMANDTHSKLNLAIHHNSYDYSVDYLKGIEIYIANDTDLDLAESLRDAILENAETQNSPKETYLVEPGIYQRFFSEYDIAQDDVQPSNKTTSTIYYYNMREVGGISTHATNDGRYAPEYPKNDYFDSNDTAEGYLLELGYMNNTADLANIIGNRNNYAKGIALGLQAYLEQE